MCHRPRCLQRDNLVGALCAELSLKQVVERRPLGLLKEKNFFVRSKFHCGVALVGAEWRWRGDDDDVPPLCEGVCNNCEALVAIVPFCFFFWYILPFCTASPIWRVIMRRHYGQIGNEKLYLS